MNISTRRRPLLSYFRPFTWTISNTSTTVTLPRGLYRIQIATPSSSSSTSNGFQLEFYLWVKNVRPTLKLNTNTNAGAGGGGISPGGSGQPSIYLTLPFSDDLIFYRNITEARAKTKLYQDGSFRIGVGGRGGYGGSGYHNPSTSGYEGASGGGGAGVIGNGVAGIYGEPTWVGGNPNLSGRDGSAGGSGQIIRYLDGSVAFTCGCGGGGGGGGACWSGGSPRGGYGGAVGGGEGLLISSGEGGPGGAGGEYAPGGSRGGGMTGNYSGSLRFYGIKLKRF
jgi:hypothetical protein